MENQFHICAIKYNANNGMYSSFNTYRLRTEHRAEQSKLKSDAWEVEKDLK